MHVLPAYIFGMALLDEWMATNTVSDEALAERLKISRVHASRLRRRVCLPSKEVAKRLEDLTAIPAAQFVFEDRA